jgi:hypothetical protein
MSRLKFKENNSLAKLVQGGQKAYQKIPPIFFEGKKDDFRYKNTSRAYNQKNKYLFGMKGGDKNGGR